MMRSSLLATNCKEAIIDSETIPEKILIAQMEIAYDISVDAIAHDIEEQVYLFQYSSKDMEEMVEETLNKYYSNISDVVREAVRVEILKKINRIVKQKTKEADYE